MSKPRCVGTGLAACRNRIYGLARVSAAQHEPLNMRFLQVRVTKNVLWQMLVLMGRLAA